MTFNTWQCDIALKLGFILNITYMVVDVDVQKTKAIDLNYMQFNNHNANINQTQ